MNDTFDNCTFSNFDNYVLDVSNVKNATKGPLELEKSQSVTKSDVSFDDSLFLNTQLLTLLKDNEDSSSQAICNGNNPPLENKAAKLSQNCKNGDLSEEKDCTLTVISPPEVRNTNDSLQDDMFNEPPSTIPKSRDCINGDDLFNQTAPNASPPTLPKSCASSSRQLSSWGLPRSILEKYAARKISTMFPWQVECLNNPKILKHHANLVYSAPTSAGKTLVAEILAIKTVLERRKKVLFILPFVSVVREKMFYFQDIFSGSGVRVEGFMGSYNPPGGFQSVQFAVCTIEKANSLVNNFLQEGSLGEIGAVIIDEMHLLGEPNRGYLLELLLTKLRYVSLRDDHVDMQIIGMSATLPNLGVLAKWLDAELYVTDFRPIPLYEQAQICGALYDNKFNLIRRLSPLPELETDTDNILQLCIETISANCSVLIFCPTKNWCENLAQQIASAFLRLGSGKSNKVGNDISNIGQELRRQLKPEPIGEVLEQLRFCPVGLDGVLRKTVSFGVAFHHAGLTLDERDIVEAAFRNGVVRVLVATSTLSSGVNLPARRVIIRSPLAHGKPLDSLTYRQMIGRAGRMGKDTSGESILVCQKNDEQIARSLMCQQLRPIESCLEEGKLKRAILEIVASGVASSPRDVELFTKCTLLAQSDNFDSPIKEALEFLVTNEFLRLQDGAGQYVATSLGRACLSSSIPPEDGLSLFTELEKARQCFVLETELHLIYLVTPYSACHQWGNLDWMFYLNLWEKLPASMRKVGELVGVRESYIVGATRGKPQTNTSKLYHKYLVHKRFFVALALQDLVNERPLSEVCAKFSCNRGMLQSLQLTASTFAGMVTSFSRQLGWSSVEILISQFQDRLHFGVSRDLLDLMRLPILNGKSARALYDGGLQTVIQLANSEIGTIESVLSKVVPFESGKMRDGESEFGLKERNKFRNIWITGREGLTEREAAEVLLTSAREFLRVEMGLKEAKWDNSGGTSGNEELSTAGEEQKIDSGGASSPLGAENGDQKDDVKLNVSVSGGVSSPVGVENRNGCKSIPDLMVSNGKLKSLNISDSSDIFSPLNSSVSRVGGKDFKEQLNVSGISDVFSPLRQQNSHTNPNVTSDGSLFETSIGETPSRLNTATRNTSRTSLNSSGDFVTTSQDESYFSFRENTPRVSRKRPKTGKENRFLLQMQSPRKKKKISNESSLNEIETVDVCSHDELFKVFCGEAKREEMISLAVVCSPREEKTKTIGLTPDPGLDTRDKFVYKNRKVDGFAMFWGGSTTYYLDLSKMEKCVDFVKLLLSNKHLTVTMFDCKEQIKVLKRCCEVEFCARTEDPKVGVWLLEPEGREKSFQEMVQTYCPNLSGVSQLCGLSNGIESPSLNLHSSVQSKTRSCVESFVTWHLTKAVKQELKDQNQKLLGVYATEMSCLRSLARMELVGVGVDVAKLTHLGQTLHHEQMSIERKAYTLAGRRFSFTSSRDVAKILGLSKGQKVSTRKQILEKNDNPVAGLVLQWRKINCTITKMVQPLIRSVEKDRIHGCCVVHTATGRITMHEPNLQNVAKNFDVEGMKVSCRDAFVPREGHVLVSADYCQLELRLLAHLSQDELLCRIMRSEGDVFRSVAAKWNNIEEEQVTDDLRQHSKQICYGIIYGMGSKTLSEQLSIDETRAAVFMETFKGAYPGVKRYLQEVVEGCKENGFVETLAGRRRYLPHVDHRSVAVRSQAERQAVNTTIQGSAADVVKRAMVVLEEKCGSIEGKPELILHLHDELLYEVSKSSLKSFVAVLRKSMEEAVKLSVPFPVKVKTGPSWGQLAEYKM